MFLILTLYRIIEWNITWSIIIVNDQNCGDSTGDYLDTLLFLRNEDDLRNPQHCSPSTSSYLLQSEQNSLYAL